MKGRKKISGIVLGLAFCFTLAGCGTKVEDSSRANTGNSKKEETYKELNTGDVAPEFTAELVDGGEIILSEQKGKVVLLNFWATWCGPCVGEMPAFERLAEEYKDRVVIVAVNCMEDESTVAKFVKENGYTFPVAYDVEGEICDKYPSDGIPYTLVIDQEGVIQKIYLGAGDAEEQYEEYKKAIDAVLGE
ncbi:MAG: TlpA family protein disulfide reductase [Lachnospiraceae bacterium]|nr:TlpA family protein disulfide reductase [Lachnospiraceae bacterium]